MRTGRAVAAIALLLGALAWRPPAAWANELEVAAEAGSDVALASYSTQARFRGEATDWLWQNLGLGAIFGTGQLGGDSLYQGGADGALHLWLSNRLAIRTDAGVMFYELSRQGGVSGTPVGLFLDAGFDYVLTPSFTLTLLGSFNYAALSDKTVGSPLFIDVLGGLRIEL